MHPHTLIGGNLHRKMFEVLKDPRHGAYLDNEWVIYSIDRAIGPSSGRPDWVLLNGRRQVAIICDPTAQYRQAHVNKGASYVRDLYLKLHPPGTWTIHYCEGYWLDNLVDVTPYLP